MNWEAIGAIGELIGATGVIFSLVYLAVQIRNQIKENQIAVNNSLTQQWGELMQALAADQTLYGIWRRGVEDFEGLSEIERGRFSSILANFSQIFESVHLHHTEGRVDEQIWEGFELRIRDIFSTPGVRTWWSHRSHWHSKRFQTFISKEINSAQNDIVYTEIYTAMAGERSASPEAPKLRDGEPEGRDPR